MRKKLGITLLELSLINEDQLKEALLLQQSSNKRLGKILADLGYVNEKQLVLTLSLQLSIPVADFSKYEPPVGLADILPREKAERKMTLPLQKDEHNLLVAMADPLDWHTIEDLFFHTGLEIKVAVSTEEEILNAIDKFYGHLSETHNLLKEIPTYEGVELIKEQDVSSETHGINLQALYKESEAPPIVRLVTMIIADAANSQASDIHIEPREDLVEVRYRIDGVLHSVHNLPKNIQNSVISRVKIISNLDITNRRYPQDGRSALKLQDKTIDLRISTLPSIFGETVVIRLLDPKLGLVALDALGISSHVLEPLSAIFTQPQGMILITGP
ncbi:Flp pilus assembly complex ATPase component TadA, partial [bacterium]|nr:Flp pilus assembly complex ATPase component TadA [bacterium]